MFLMVADESIYVSVCVSEWLHQKSNAEKFQTEKTTGARTHTQTHIVIVVVLFFSLFFSNKINFMV